MAIGMGRGMPFLVSLFLGLISNCFARGGRGGGGVGGRGGGGGFGGGSGGGGNLSLNQSLELVLNLK